MAIQPAPQTNLHAQAQRRLADYRVQAGDADILAGSPDPAWAVALAGAFHTDTAGLDAAARPTSVLPLLIPAPEWWTIAAGVAQRAALLEAVLVDLHGSQSLVADGRLPAALVAGSSAFLRPVVGLTPAGGRHLHFAAFDLIRGPAGEWRVAADHTRAPAGLGLALENRLAAARALANLDIADHAPFFAAMRAGLAASCARTDPRIGLLTPGRHSPGHSEQVQLARHLGFLLVEGADLAALDGKLYVRTIRGLKRIDALWRCIDARLLDPLAFDSHSQIGVAGMADAWAAGNLVLANAPGAGVVEAPAFLAFLPALMEALTGAPPILPTLATWWCGQDRERAAVDQNLDRLLIAPAFGEAPLGLPDGRAIAGAALSAAARAALLADLARRPQDYVGQEQARGSTMPGLAGDQLEPRPFTLRVFAARGPGGEWTVLPGGIAQGGGGWSADVAIVGAARAATALPPPADSRAIRRNPGTLPSRVADDFFWLGRYLERGEGLLAAICLLLRQGEGAALAMPTLGRLVGLIANTGAAPHSPGLAPAALLAFARTALEDAATQSVAAQLAYARQLGGNARDRLSADVIDLLEAPFPQAPALTDRAAALARRYAALAGLAAEHTVRTDAWRFTDLGRRIERGIAVARAVRMFAMPGASADDLSALLDLADSRIAHRQLYPTGPARAAVVDLVALDPGNPRALAFQLRAIAARLAELPVLHYDGMAEPQQAQAAGLAAVAATATAAGLDADTLFDMERRLAALSDAIARRYFLQGAEPLRAGGLTLA